jgi:hypothetical protein
VPAVSSTITPEKPAPSGTVGRPAVTPTGRSTGSRSVSDTATSCSLARFAVRSSSVATTSSRNGRSGPIRSRDSTRRQRISRLASSSATGSCGSFQCSSVSSSRRSRVRHGTGPAGYCTAGATSGTSTLPRTGAPSAAPISASLRSRRSVRAATRWPSTPSTNSSTAPPITKCVRVGAAGLVGSSACPITTMLAALDAASSSSSFAIAWASVVRSPSRSVRAWTLSTVRPCAADACSSLIRSLVTAICWRSASRCSRCAWADASAVLPISWVENRTYSWATWSASCWAFSGLSAVAVMPTTLPSATSAVTESCRSLPVTSQSRAVAARSSTTELIATCASVSSSSVSRVPCSSTVVEVS